MGERHTEVVTQSVDVVFPVKPVLFIEPQNHTFSLVQLSLLSTKTGNRWKQLAKHRKLLQLVMFVFSCF